MKLSGVSEYMNKSKTLRNTWDTNDPWLDTVARYGYDPYMLNEAWDLLKFDNEKNLGYNNVNKEQKKESNDSMFDASNMMNKYFGKVANGMVRLSMNGDMAIKTSNGYKTYDVKTGTLTNCDSFVFDLGSEFFFIIPINKVETGDVILTSGKPHCVIKAENNRIEAQRQ